MGILALILALALVAPAVLESAMRYGIAGLFVAIVVFKAAASLLVQVAALAPPRLLTDEALPTYTVVAPLYQESAMAAQLLHAIRALDYPPEKLTVVVVLEPDDPKTLAAVAQASGGSGLIVLVAPEGRPRTKPRALNVALAQLNSEFVVIYDAEDRPHPAQLREAAARFAAGDGRLACLQAPLRIDGARTWLQRQFALEYAVQFEAILPVLAILGLPFPLGGTSNHFRTDALRAVGGWDAFNVTEDADVGFRLAHAGFRTGVLQSPTFEEAPRNLAEWAPQRARWIKGYIQTLKVHARGDWLARPRIALALAATLGVSVASALLHGLLTTGVAILAAVSIITRSTGLPHLRRGNPDRGLDRRAPGHGVRGRQGGREDAGDRRHPGARLLATADARVRPRRLRAEGLPLPLEQDASPAFRRGRGLTCERPGIAPGPLRSYQRLQRRITPPARPRRPPRGFPARVGRPPPRPRGWR